MMLGAVFAISSSLASALSMVSVRRGLSQSNFLSVTLIITLMGNIIFIISWSIALLLVGGIFDLLGALIFILSGLISPGIFRLLYYKGMEAVGASFTASIVAMHPMFSTVLAVLLLAEGPTPWTLVGVVCIVLGAVVIQNSIHGGSVSKGLKSTSLLPFFAAVVLGVSYVVKKVGSSLYNDPLAAVALGNFAALLLYIPLGTSSTIREHVSLDRKNLGLFWKGGLAACAAFLFSFYALQYGDVTVVVPLIQTEPLFILLLTPFYLKGLETLSVKLIAGALSIVLGVTLIALF